MPAVRLIEMICLNSNGMNDHVYLAIKLKASWVILGAARAISTCLPYLLHGFFTYFFRWKGQLCSLLQVFVRTGAVLHTCMHASELNSPRPHDDESLDEPCPPARFTE
jgi:hypothetical protein